MQRDIEVKWRPALWLVIASTILAMLMLPVVSLFVLSRLMPMFDFDTAFLIVAAGTVATAVIVGWVLWRILYRPITVLAARADEIRTGRSEALAPLEHYGTSEMEAMGRAMREMGQVLQNREVVLRSYADHVTHELKSPLTVVQGATELLADPKLPEADRSKMLQNVVDATDRMKNLLDAQRALARANDPVAAGSCLLSEVVEPADDIEVLGDGRVPLTKEALEPVLTHLIGNARAHGATKIMLELTGKTLLVQDNGPGISSGNRDRIFDPFFTTRRDSGGTGMGLSIVRRMLEAQGGSIALEDGSGARFIISF